MCIYIFLHICNLVDSLKNVDGKKVLLLKLWIPFYPPAVVKWFQHFYLEFKVSSILLYFTLRSCILQHPKPRRPRSLCQRPILTELQNITALPHGSRYVNVTISTASLLTYKPSITNFSKISCVPWFTIRTRLINKLLTLTELTFHKKTTQKTSLKVIKLYNIVILLLISFWIW